MITNTAIMIFVRVIMERTPEIMLPPIALIDDIMYIPEIKYKRTPTNIKILHHTIEVEYSYYFMIFRDHSGNIVILQRYDFKSDGDYYRALFALKKTLVHSFATPSMFMKHMQ